MNKIIVIINGSGGKGKDTFVKLCNKYVLVTNISSVDLVKEAAKILGWKNTKNEIDRKFLSDLKLLSSQYNNQPKRYIESQIKDFHASNIPLMFIHIREPQNIENIKTKYNCKTLLVKNSNVSDIKSNMADANVENYKYDYIVENNDDLDALNNKAKEFINTLFPTILSEVETNE